MAYQTPRSCKILKPKKEGEKPTKTLGHFKSLSEIFSFGGPETWIKMDSVLSVAFAS